MKPAVLVTLRVIAVACLVFFVIGLLFAVSPFLQQLKVLRTWPAADAQMVHSKVVPLRTDSGQMLYDTLLVLSYQVEGRPYVSSVGSPHQSTSYEHKKKQADRFPGAELKCATTPATRATFACRPVTTLIFLQCRSLSAAWRRSLACWRCCFFFSVGASPNLPYRETQPR